MKFIALILSILPIYAHSYSTCTPKFTGFFDRDLVSYPELDWQSRRTELGRAILEDIQNAIEITPNSEIAKNGFYGAGKCFPLTLENPSAVGALVQLDFSLAYIGLKSDRSATWYLSGPITYELISEKCQTILDRYEQSAAKALPELNAYFNNGNYELKLADRIESIVRKISLTKDGKFLLTKSRLGRTPPPTDEPLFQVCAYPTTR